MQRHKRNCNKLSVQSNIVVILDQIKDVKQCQPGKTLSKACMRLIILATLNRKFSYRRQTARRVCANTTAWLTPIKHTPPNMCHHAEFGQSVLKGVLG